MMVSVCPDISDVLSFDYAGGRHGVDDFSVLALGVGALFFVGP
jgi:hypothetical protein